MNAAQQSLFTITVDVCAIGSCGRASERKVEGFPLCEEHARSLEAQSAPKLPPFQPSSDTSRAAAVAIQPHVAPMQKRVLDFLEERGIVGGTQEEIHFATGMRISSICGRVSELRELGKVCDSGERRANVSGVGAVVWISALSATTNPASAEQGRTPQVAD